VIDVVATRGSKVPDADLDEVVAVFFAHHVSGMEVIQTGVLTLQSTQVDQKRLRQIKFETLETELDLFNRLIDLILESDPDILTGWDVQLSSWGYLEARSNVHGRQFRPSSRMAPRLTSYDQGLTFSDLISRAPPRHPGPPSTDQWGLRKTSTFKVAGRHVLNLWRVMRSERTLTIYTFEHVLFDVLGKRCIPE